MKKINLLLTLALAVILASCSNTSLNYPAKSQYNYGLNSTITLIPGANEFNTLDYITDVAKVDSVTSDFEGVKVKKIIKTTDAYTFVEEFDVYLSNKTQIEFDMVGAWNEITLKNKKVEMPRFIYPNRVVDTIDNQYADKKIVKVSNDGMEYEIKFKDGSEVTINALGKILEFEK